PHSTVDISSRSAGCVQFFQDVTDNTAHSVYPQVDGSMFPAHFQVGPKNTPQILGKAGIALSAKLDQRVGNALDSVTGSAITDDDVAVFTLTKCWIKTSQRAYIVSPEQHGRRADPEFVGERLCKCHDTKKKQHPVHLRLV